MIPPTWLAAALEPLTALPWRAAFAVFDGLLLAAIAGGVLLCGRSLGWTTRRRRLAALCVVLSPIGFLNLFMGQVSALVFFGLAGAWALARGGRPILGGLLLTLSWIKPNIGLPLCLVVMLLQPAVSRRILAGFLGGTAVAFLYAFAWLGQGFFAWPLQVPRAGRSRWPWHWRWRLPTGGGQSAAPVATNADSAFSCSGLRRCPSSSPTTWSC